MIFPLEQLIEYDGNIYEITCAAIRRAYQISVVADPKKKNEVDSDKAVSIAAKQLFTNQIEYKNIDEEQ